MTDERPEEQIARLDLATPPGVPGSGRLRYAAAMQLYRRGRLGEEVLEVYRICSPLDAEDPLALLAARGLAGEVPAACAPTPAMALGRLVDEADRYLAGLAGPGIAEVRSLVARWRGGPVDPQPGLRHPVCEAHLGPALATLAPGHPALTAAIAVAAPHLDWISYDLYPPDEIGPDFAAGHAFASLIGEDAPITAADFDLGLFLIAPDVLYRDHRHPAPELYAPLTGPHGWRFGPGAALTILPAHQPVWNEPGTPHLTKVGAVPFLGLFAWTRDVALPAQVVPAADWPELEAMRIGG